MKFDDNLERSTELLRIAVPLMSKQRAAMHPMSYAVWYTYAREPNSPLHAAADQCIKQHGQLDEATTEALYHRYVANVDPATAQRIVEGFQNLLNGMSDSAALASDETARYGASLDRLSQELQAEHLPSSLDEVREHTLQMQAMAVRLQQRLESSQREIGQLRQEVQRARQESLQDGLTGLANRRNFDQQLAAFLARDASSPDPLRACLVMADIDHFKRINDTYGHAFGDQVIKAVAQVLKTHAPEGGVAARVGGEEFALLLPPMPVDQANLVAEKVRDTIAASRIRARSAADVQERVTISLGVTQLRTNDSAVTFIDRADQALYASKHGGRNRVTVLAS